MKMTTGKNNAEVDETVEFLDWLVKDNFTLMGYRQYELSPIQGDYELKGVMETSLGLMKNAGVGTSSGLYRLCWCKTF